MPINNIKIYFIVHHFVSHYIHRYKVNTEIPFYFRALINDIDITSDIDINKLFMLLIKKFRRLEATQSQTLAASSIVKLLINIINNTGEIIHVPSPNGLPGGYPLRVIDNDCEIILPPNEEITLEKAINLNQKGQKLDGIDKIDSNGTVCFS